jgi:N-glycosidase YbiA
MSDNTLSTPEAASIASLDGPITAFRGEFAFLSNFYPHAVTFEGETYPTAEHAFQAAKTLDPAERQKVRDAVTPAVAKRLGKKVALRDGWDTVRFTVMEQVVAAKFSDPDLARLLLATGERELIEGNTWRDTIWGCIQDKNGNWKGRNELGKTLMRLRATLPAEKDR